MIRIVALFVGLISFSATAQHDCQHCKNRSNDFLKSSVDNLRSDTVDINHYDVYLDFTQMGTQHISGHCKVHFTAKMNINTLSLDLLQLSIDSITHTSGLLTYGYNDTLIVTQLANAMNPGESDSIVVYYNGTPQGDPSGWGGFYFQNNYAYNLGVGFSADPHNYGRVWHPCFDNFAERAGYTYRILTNAGRTAYCNGARQSVLSVGIDSLLTTWQMDDPIPSYLASIAVSDYTHSTRTHISTVNGLSIPIWLIAQASDTSNMKSSFINIESAVETFEQSYGPHAWNKIGFVLVPFNSGAMEHATNIAYPLSTANGSLQFETLYAHELAHHWWGDLVTCLTEEEMWINEGMASYSEKRFLELLYDRDRYMDEVRDNHYQVVHLAHIIDSGFYALNAVPHAYTYGEHSYNKGSDVAHTLRSYMGDSLFFEGLKSVINTHQGGNLSSVQFMSHLNTISGVDVTDFFNDWIFSPGFSHFSVNHFNVSGSGPYNVDLVVDQKLKGTSAYHNNVPLTITFMDENFNTHEAPISMNGPYQLFNFSVPFEPSFVAINMDERINDATTAISDVIQSTGMHDYPYANARLTVSNVTDSILVRCEHNWVAPDNNGVPAGIVISHERYWNFHGIIDNSFEATMRFNYNGQLNNAGHMDNELLQDIGSQVFIEDSIVLLYRPDAQSAWTVHPDYILNFTGSNTDKKGIVTTGGFMTGQYTWGYRTQSVGIKDHSNQSIELYPNPADDQIVVEHNLSSGKLQYEIYNLEGQLVQNGSLVRSTVSTKDLISGTYVICIKDEEHIRARQKMVIVH